MTASWMDINKPPSPATAVTAAQVANGPIFPPQQRLLTYSPDEWEGFVEEWAYYCLTTKYEHVLRFSGAGDMGIDVAGFVGDERLLGVWDNFQSSTTAMPSGLVMFGLSSGRSSGTRTKVNIRSLVATTLFRHEVLVRRLAAYFRMTRSCVRNC